MKKPLLLLLAALSYGLPAAYAQVLPTGPDEFRQPQTHRPGDTPMAAYFQAVAPAARAGTVNRHTRESAYVWFNNRWSASVAINTLSYNAQAQIVQVVRTDSATQRPSSRTTRTYNAAEQLTYVQEESWSGSAWLNTNLALYTYDTSGRYTGYIDQAWNGSAWVNSSRFQYAYDIKGNTASYVAETWTNGAWVISNSAQRINSYDAQGRLTESVENGWDTASQTYVPYSRFSYTYPGSSTFYSGFVQQTWVDNAWVNLAQFKDYTYNAQNLVTYYEYQSWVNSAWRPIDRAYYTYTTNDNYVSVVQRLMGSTWVNYSRYTRDYSADGASQTTTYETWQGNTGTWQLDSGQRFLHAYNATNNLVRRLYQRVNQTTHTFVNSDKYYYSDFQAFVLASRPATLLSAQTQLYPNPAATQATVELSGLRAQGSVRVELLNSLGQAVRTLTVEPQHGTIRQPLDVQALPAGVYTIRLHTAEGTVIRRLVKE